MKKLFTPFCILLSFFLLSSCISNRKISTLHLAIENQKKLEEKLSNTLQTLNKFREEKTAIGELDDTSSLAIKKLLDKEVAYSRYREDSLAKMQAKLSEKRVKIRDYKNMLTIITSGDSVIVLKMETVDFVDQLLKQQTFIKFNTATFFPPGGYIIPDEKKQDAKKAFSPLIDSLIFFVLRFPKFTLYPSIVASGYADGQGFAPGALVEKLNANLGKTDASKEELNMELSRLRASEVSGILYEIFKDKIAGLSKASMVESKFYQTGKGEEYPNKKIKNYMVDDERRRIVVLYWNALPKVE
jgi:hypothetical protein